MLRLGSSGLELHRLGGDLVSSFEVEDALVAVRAVAVADVAREGVVEGVPVQVVGVLDDELADRLEVALDAVEVAGISRRRDELDVVGLREGPDVRRPVGAEVVLDPVDPQPLGVAAADLAHEGEVVAAASAWAQPGAQAVGVHVIGTEDVAGALEAIERCALSFGALSFGPAAAGVRAQADRARLIEADRDPALRSLLVERVTLAALAS